MVKEDEEITTIQLKKGTRNKLLDIGKKGEPYDDLLLRLIAEYTEARR